MVRSHLRDESADSLVTGWRVWRISTDQGSALLSSTERQFLWDDRSVRARCVAPMVHLGVSDWYRQQRRRPEHAAPAVVCECGIYAYWSRDLAMADPSLGKGTLRAVGSVQLSERILETADGLRAEAARVIGPISLVGECGRTDPSEQPCGSVVVLDLDTVAMRCLRHSGAGWPSAEAGLQLIQQQLEAKYQVEVDIAVRVSYQSL